MDSSIKDFSEIHLVKNQRSLMVYQDRFEFRKDRHFPWLQKAALWVLEKTEMLLNRLR